MCGWRTCIAARYEGNCNFVVPNTSFFYWMGSDFGRQQPSLQWACARKMMEGFSFNIKLSQVFHRNFNDCKGDWLHFKILVNKDCYFGLAVFWVRNFGFNTLCKLSSSLLLVVSRKIKFSIILYINFSQKNFCFFLLRMNNKRYFLLTRKCLSRKILPATHIHLGRATLGWRKTWAVEIKRVVIVINVLILPWIVVLDSQVLTKYFFTDWRIPRSPWLHLFLSQCPCVHFMWWNIFFVVFCRDLTKKAVSLFPLQLISLMSRVALWSSCWYSPPARQMLTLYFQEFLQ